MIPNKWNKNEYDIFVKYLISLKDEKYKKFHSSLCLSSNYEIIGIRLPILRKIAKDISKTNVVDFLNVSGDKYYEEIMIQGLVISLIKDEELFYEYFKKFINKIDNWAICDTFCNSIKIIKKHENKYFKLSIDLALNKEEFISRTGLIMILSNFINENNLSQIFNVLNEINSDKYYINMAEAWLICELYIKFPEQTNTFIKSNKLNKFTHNKAISKIHDSYRVSNEEKERLNLLRKK